MNEMIVAIFKSFLLFSISILVITISFLAYKSPDLNYSLADQLKINAEKTRQVELSANKEKDKKLKEWVRSGWSDVGTTSEKYPLVIIRDGFKIIKINDNSALIGWKMDILNTSISSQYYPKVTYTVTDNDGFKLNSSTKSGDIPAESFGTIQGTMTIPLSDLERIDDKDWTIIVENWKSKEKNAKGKRYERLAKLVANADKRPFWIDKMVKEEPSILLFSDKWKTIKDAIATEVATSEPTNQDSNK